MRAFKVDSPSPDLELKVDGLGARSGRSLRISKRRIRRRHPRESLIRRAVWLARCGGCGSRSGIFTSLLHTRAPLSARALTHQACPRPSVKSVPALRRAGIPAASPRVVRSDLELRIDHSVGRRLVDAALALLQPELRARHHDDNMRNMKKGNANANVRTCTCLFCSLLTLLQ